MKDLLLVELTRLRWRRAVACLLVACLLVPAAIWVGTAWDTRPFSDSAPKIARASVDFPEPDSPTMPIEPPASSAKLTSDTAVTGRPSTS